MFKNFRILIFILVGLILISVGINLNVGFMELDFSDFFDANSPQNDIAQLRINRVLIMLLAGLSIPTSGFLLQEYFRNPLAGPSVLGITSMASLFVAIFLFFSQNWLLPDFWQYGLMSVFSILGSLIILTLLLIVSQRFKEQSYIIIFGFLVSALSGAIISLLQFYAENQALKNYILWSFGGNNLVSLPQISLLSVFIFIGLFLSFKAIKPLIGLGLGENYAQSFGVNLALLKNLIIVASSLLSASITAFLGPVLFIGIIVPHFSRMIWNPAQLWHQWILNMLLGILIMEFFSIISEISQLPLNTITSLFGIPVIFLMMMKRSN